VFHPWLSRARARADVPLVGWVGKVTMRRCLLSIAVVSGLLFPVGCGPSGPRFYDVSGTVVFDGRPVAVGDIYFVPENPAYGTDAGKVRDGKFHFRAKEGKHRVEIRASRPVPGKLAPDGFPYFEVYIPAKYNDKTVLTAEVTPGGPNRFDFTMVSSAR
jgi:hypothetical protein